MYLRKYKLIKVFYDIGMMDSYVYAYRCME